MNIEKIVKEQRKYFNKFNTRDINSRINTLKTIQKWILNNEDKIYEALQKDLNKSTAETYMCEIGMALSDIRYQINHLKKWSKRKMVLTSLAQFPSIGYKYYEPYGVTLVMSTWNYPFLLSVQPTIASIAAGNTVILKPSAYAPNTSLLLNEMFTETCNKNLVTVVEGGRHENEEILNQKYDYIFFTGSSSVGKIIMSKASEHLTPVTLELGGKSPCIIDDDDNFKTCVKRCIFGKLLNSGQTCIATDYLFIRDDLKERFIEEARIIIEDFFGDNPLASDQMVKIVNKKHFDRLNGLLNDEKILLGGKIDLKTFKIEPTLVEIKSKDSKLMQEEIFGPILPIMTYKNIDEVIKYINDHEKPLACYIFSSDKIIQDKIIQECSFGGGCINGTIMHVLSHSLPFGGVGKSGMGSYHGKYSFKTFSHEKSILKKFKSFDFSTIYYPYNKFKLKIAKRIMK